MAENTLSFLWLIAVLLVPVVLVVRAFLAGGWLIARFEVVDRARGSNHVWDAVATTAVAAAFARHAPRHNWQRTGGSRRGRCSTAGSSACAGAGARVPR